MTGLIQELLLPICCGWAALLAIGVSSLHLSPDGAQATGHVIVVGLEPGAALRTTQNIS
jgi:hypothetical protein